jgi:intein/homing endonuclease
MPRDFHPGMGQAVAERTILRKKEVDGKQVWETWSDVAHRVALGNSLLCPSTGQQKKEYDRLHKHLSKATLLMSGRHLQHGDETQPSRNMEVFTNCSTSMTSFAMFYLLMNGSGVGRCYDDDLMLADWDNSPTLRCVLDESHPDFDYSAHESVRDARHKFGDGKDVLWYSVEDTREGWAKALEMWENAAFEKIHKDKMLILDFSPVRAKGSPIKGMQGRPASGPVPLMNAFNKAATLKGAGLPRWKQAMYLDHYFAECVLVGGARRAARMSTKTWRDQSVLEFITIKRPIEYQDKTVEEILDLRANKQFPPLGFLWSSNNSIMVDEDFWRLLDLKKTDEEYVSEDAKHARAVFKKATEAAYADGTGEPGFINAHRLHASLEGVETLKNESIHSEKFKVFDDTHLYLNRLLKAAKKKRYFMLVNPCVTADTWVQTSEGPRQVSELIDSPFHAVVNGKAHQTTGFWHTGDKTVYRLQTKRGYYLDLTEDHLIQVEANRRQKAGGGYNFDHLWIKAKDLKAGDRVVLNKHSILSWNGTGTFSEGWLAGEIVGDGGYNPAQYPTYVRFWGGNKSALTNYAIGCIREAGLETRSDFTGGIFSEIHDSETTKCSAMSRVVDGLIEPETKRLLPALERCSSSFYRGFLRGLFDADGTVACNAEKGRSVRLSQSNIETLVIVQRMLARLGIASSIYANRQEAGFKEMPDGKGESKFYWCKANHELVISKDNINRFQSLVGFADPTKSELLDECVESLRRGPYEDDFTSEVVSVELLGENIPVYDCTVDDVHAIDANGIMAHNCGEIPLAIWGAFCTIADIVPYHADTLEEAEDAFRAAARALIRVNLMDSIYKKEVQRTNRIGVGITGIHEFAWKFFKLGFRDLIDEEVSKEFWMTMSRFKRAVQDECEKYSAELGVVCPHTDTTIKPAGTTSKLFGLTEGWHLASMLWYMRWVQFSKNDPLVAEYHKNGYPTQELKQYKNTVIVGFPTVPVIAALELGDKMVTAAQATPEQQYRWLMLGEKYWLHGVNEDGTMLERDSGSQISYTLKYKPESVDFRSFKKTLRKYQSQIKCCSVMPQEEVSSYEYLPEQPVTKAQYEAVVADIKRSVVEDVDFKHIDCANGACPVDFKK